MSGGLAMKKELILNGLACAQCAQKIENKIQNIPNINNASLNFATKTLNIELIEGTSVDVIMNKVRETIKSVESHIIIIEKNEPKELEINIKGLHCVNCAKKIEEAVGDLKEVDKIQLNFANGKLKVLPVFSDDNNILRNKIIKIIKSLEPDVKIEEENIKKEKINIPWRLVMGTILFSVAIINNFSFSIELVLFSISYILIGGDIVLRAVKNIFRGQVFDENFLMFVATVGAFLIQQFPEAVAVMLFYQVGEFLQGKAVERSRNSIQSLIDIKPPYANLWIDGQEKRVIPEKVSKGDFIIVRPGESIPVDGMIIEGDSFVDTSAITGEFTPQKVKAGQEVLSGFINKNGVIKVRVTKEYGQSTIARIIDLVQNAGENKASTEKFITKFARVYTPIVVFLAVLIAFLPPLLIREAQFATWIYRGLVFLVISCPCALVISIPLGFFGGIGAASRKGILIKGGNFLEALNYVNTVVYDKTGTLTKGVFKVTGIEVVENISREELLEYAAIGEHFSNHPIAQSIKEVWSKNVDTSLIKSYKEIPGKGIKALYKDKVILVGNEKLMLRENIEILNEQTKGTVVHVAVDRKYYGKILISDEIKVDAPNTIRELKSLGIVKQVMLTGDNREVAQDIGKELNLDKVFAELLPSDKLTKLELLIKENSTKGKIIFVGDGINDAPALKRADIGIAMGGLGADVAIEAADIVFMTDEPSKLVSLIRIAKKTKKIIWQNIYLALGVKFTVLLLGVIGLATMWAAVFADVGVALLAILNAIRILK